MPPVPSSSSSDSQSQDSSNTLQEGLAAFHRRDYAQVIELLESNPLTLKHPLRAKAQMALVIAYARNRDPLKAASLCQSLGSSKNPQIRAWAARTHKTLQKRYPQLEYSTLTGDEDIQQGSQAIAAEAEAEADLTGFVALDLDSTFEEDSTGFVVNPLEDRQPQKSVGEVVLPALTVSEPNTQDPKSKFQELQSTIQELQSQGKPGVKPNRNVKKSSFPNSDSATTGNVSGLEQSDPYQPGWRQAGRASRGQSLGKVKLTRFLLGYGATALVLFWMVREIIFRILLTYSISLTKIPFLNFQRVLFGPPTWAVLIGLILLLIGSRWLLDAQLTKLHGLKPLLLMQLSNFSPESIRVIREACRQRRWPLPALGVLPTAEPMIFSYGCLPRVTRIVVSQGLLDQLTDDEIAALYANELGHLVYRTVPFFSLATVVNQVPYALYWVVAEWGNRQSRPFTRICAALAAGFGYGIYALTRWPVLWLSRQRVYLSDRIAVELTSNPNGYARALLKIAIGTAEAVEKQGKTSYLLEGFDLLTPLGSRMATTMGSLYPHGSLESVLEWDRSNPDRHWLAINNSHPPTGDRLNLLMLYARHWRLDPELNFESGQRMVGKGLQGNKVSQTVSKNRNWRSLLLLGAPFWGLGIGLLAVLVAYFVGWILLQQRRLEFAWIYGDQGLFIGLLLLGFSIGTLIRINRFFPDSQLSYARDTGANTTLLSLMQNPNTIPLDSVPIQLSGQLLGRAGIGNLLSQDLLLKTSTGLVRLHWISLWGPIGNLLTQQLHPSALIHQEVMVTGWFRRGATPWIDVEVIRTSSGQMSRSQHPMWSTMLVLFVAIVSAWALLNGGL